MQALFLPAAIVYPHRKLQMKMKHLLAGFAASLMFVMPVMADEDSPLAKNMEAVNDAYKAMRRETDPAKGAALAREAQDAVIKAISETPELVKSLPAGEQARASAEYRRATANLLITFTNMEIAFIDGDMDKVKELVTEVRSSKKKGHEKFMEEE